MLWPVSSPISLCHSFNFFLQIFYPWTGLQWLFDCLSVNFAYVSHCTLLDWIQWEQKPVQWYKKEASDKYLLREGVPFLYSKELRPENVPKKWLSELYYDGEQKTRGKRKRAGLRPWTLSNYHALYITSVLNVQMDKSLKQSFMVSGTREEL